MYLLWENLDGVFFHVGFLNWKQRIFVFAILVDNHSINHKRFGCIKTLLEEKENRFDNNCGFSKKNQTTKEIIFLLIILALKIFEG